MNNVKLNWESVWKMGRTSNLYKTSVRTSFGKHSLKNRKIGEGIILK
jgi:hypothetical protein